MAKPATAPGYRTPLHERTSPKEVAFGFLKFCAALLVIGFLITGIPYVLPANWQLKYQLQYSVDADKVTIERQPHNCDWDSAPLGDKHCHYRAVVTVLNSTSQVVGGSDVEVDISTPGTSLISYDGGKTWNPNPAGNNVKPVSVLVTWHKVEE